MSDTHDSNNPQEPKLVRVTRYQLTWFDADIEGGTKLQSADFDTREDAEAALQDADSFEGIKVNGIEEITEEVPEGDLEIPAEVIGPPPAMGSDRPTRVFTLDPRACDAQEVIDGLKILIDGLIEEKAKQPNMRVRFEVDDSIASSEPPPPESADNQLAEALREQAKAPQELAHVNDFAQAVQTAMRKNHIQNCAWVVVVPPKGPEEQPRFITGGTDRTHAWFRESLEMAAQVRMMLAQRQQAGAEGMKVLQSGLAVPDTDLAVPKRPTLILPGD